MARRKGGFGSIILRGSMWYVRIRKGEGGSLKDWKRAVSTDRATAEAKLASMRVALEVEKHLGIRPSPRVSLRAFLPSHERHLRGRLTPDGLAIVTAQLRRAADFLGPASMAEVSRAKIEDLVSRLRREGKSGATCNRYLAAVSGAFRAAVERGLASVNPCIGLRRSKEEERPVPWLSAGDLARIFAATPGPYRPLVTLAADTGMRLSEVLALEWRDVDLGRGAVTVRRSKSGRSRLIPLTGRARKALAGLPRASGPVFGQSSSAVTRQFPRWAERAAVRGRLTFHGLRHSYCSRLAAAGVPPVDLMKLSGHSTLSQVLRYMRHAPDDSAWRAVERLERHEGAGATKARKGPGKAQRGRRASI